MRLAALAALLVLAATGCGRSEPGPALRTEAEVRAAFVRAGLPLERVQPPLGPPAVEFRWSGGSGFMHRLLLVDVYETTAGADYAMSGYFYTVGTAPPVVERARNVIAVWGGDWPAARAAMRRLR